MRMLIFVAGLCLATAASAAAQSLPAPAGGASEKPGTAAARADLRPKPAAGDPVEGFNRRMFQLNDELDRHAFRPLAMGYFHIVPRPVRTGLHNVYANLGDVRVFANDVLQAHPREAGTTFGRIATNSTLGVAGLFDVATPSGLPHHDNDFGMTLGRAGVQDGPYLFLPILGPSNMRDLGGSIFDAIAFKPLAWVDSQGAVTVETRGLVVSQGLDRRANVDGELQALRETSLDAYASMRSVYTQSRRNAIARGASRMREFPDFDELDEESAAPPVAAAAPEPEPRLAEPPTVSPGAVNPDEASPTKASPRPVSPTPDPSLPKAIVTVF
jgi:phospholipid-binding lipoprotein MlaA